MRRTTVAQHREPIAGLPRRIVTLSTYDAGPVDGQGAHANCPHCGAEGRYIHSFLCDDGSIHAAMSGCINLFGTPQRTALAVMADAALKKQQEQRDEFRRTGTTKKLASWFVPVVEALEKLQNKQMTLEQAQNIASVQYQRREEWLRNNGYRR